MSKVRAQRRAEREAVAAAARRVRQRQVARRSRRRRLAMAVGRPLLALRPRRRPASLLRRHRRRQDAWLVGALLAANGLVWLFDSSWPVRGGLLALSVLSWPLLITVIFDRGRST